MFPFYDYNENSPTKVVEETHISTKILKELQLFRDMKNLVVLNGFYFFSKRKK